MANPIERSRNFIQAINTANYFTEIVDGTFDLVNEQKKVALIASKARTLFVATIAFGIASIITVPWEIVSRIRQGHYALRGYGFLCPVLGIGIFAFCFYFANSGLNRQRVLEKLYFNSTLDPKNIPYNLQIIQTYVDQLFQELKAAAPPEQKPEALPFLIHLYFLKNYCRTLATAPADVRARKKDSQGHYFNYTTIFEINAEYLRSSPTKQVELLKQNISLITMFSGKSLSVDQVCANLGLTAPTS